MTDSWVTTHDARPFNDRVVHLNENSIEQHHINISRLNIVVMKENNFIPLFCVSVSETISSWGDEFEQTDNYPDLDL